ncbi:hypothetical protein BD289DRAFT_423351 [Coniella lustricola]|uniref:Methyltransferase type 12 domain-containing protein n=1 Tax=Coniella lustricola TaxID=2025994 RepID=A0A2T3AJR9_9PEZI|nr:hypothetical protein BD289DRAFT_423351 [Coniella lustricola]
MFQVAEIRTNTLKSEADCRSARSVVEAIDEEESRQGWIQFSRVDLEELAIGSDGYDLVFCGLALHSIKHIQNVMLQVYASLKEGGLFVFSIEHPFLTAPTRTGFTKTLDGEVGRWPVDSYFEEGERGAEWLVKGVKKQHRTLTSFFALIVGALVRRHQV